MHGLSHHGRDSNTQYQACPRSWQGRNCSGFCICYGAKRPGRSGMWPQCFSTLAWRAMMSRCPLDCRALCPHTYPPPLCVCSCGSKWVALNCPHDWQGSSCSKIQESMVKGQTGLQAPFFPLFSPRALASRIWALVLLFPLSASAL